MLTSLLLSGLPVFLITVGGIITAACGLHLVVATSGMKRPHDRSGAGMALGLAMMIVMWLWNGILAVGFRALRIDEDAALAVQQSGDLFDDILLSTRIAIITIVAIAVVTAVIATLIGVTQRIALSRQTVRQEPVVMSPRAADPATPGARTHGPTPLL